MEPAERNSRARLKRLALVAVLILAGIAFLLGLLFWVGTDGGITANPEVDAQV